MKTKLTFVFKNNQGSMVRYVDMERESNIDNLKELIADVVSTAPDQRSSIKFNDLDGVRVVVSGLDILYAFVGRASEDDD